MDLKLTRIKNILTRTTGFLKTITSHSAQPYRGCTLGRSLCGVGCYVQHNGHITHGRPWGGFLEVRENAAASYEQTVDRERRWARRARETFDIFLSSSTEPFLPQERKYHVTRRLLGAIAANPPDGLVVQTHSHTVTEHMEILERLATRCSLRVHVSIETDRERVPGLPPHASSVAHRLDAARRLKEAGIYTVITVAPLLPIENPESFFSRIAASADAVVIDHFIGGDGSADGSRTRRTSLPTVIDTLHPGASGLAYRDAMVEIARRHLPARTGINIDGFAGRYLPRT